MKKNLDPAFCLGVPFASFRGQKRGYQDTRCSGPSLIWVFSGLKFLWHGKHILSGLIVLFYFFLKNYCSPFDDYKNNAFVAENLDM